VAHFTPHPPQLVLEVVGLQKVGTPAA